MLLNELGTESAALFDGAGEEVADLPTRDGRLFLTLA